jgi:hypothetical protein
VIIINLDFIIYSTYLGKKMDNKLEELYHEFWSYASDKMSKHDPEAVAAIMSAQSMSIYKTIMNSEDYEKIVTAIYNSRDKVKSLNDARGHVLQ